MKIKKKKEINSKKLFRAAQIILEALGEDPNREGVKRTPERISRDWPELFEGYTKTKEEILNKTFDAEDYDEMVIVRDIEFYSFCEHHILPFFGVAHVAYIPNKKIVGLDKIVKLVWMYSRRLQNQERLTHQIATALMDVLKPQGVMVVLSAKHFCMSMRGTRVQESTTVTSSIKGVFRSVEEKAREEFLKLIEIDK